MKRIKILVIALAVLLTIPVVAFADTTAEVEVTFTVGELGITVSPSTWENLSAAPAKTWTSDPNGFTLTNTGDYRVNTTIKGADAVGNDGHTWTLSSDGINREDTYAMKFIVDQSEGVITVSELPFLGGLDADQYKGFGLSAAAPTNSNCMNPGEKFSTTVTIKATPAD